jgi:hypothetical protein
MPHHLFNLLEMACFVRLPLRNQTWRVIASTPLPKAKKQEAPAGWYFRIQLDRGILQIMIAQ